MKKCLLAPDSFKGTLHAGEVCALLRAEILQRYPGCRIIAIPIADGGEGTVDCLLTARGGRKKKLQVRGPLGDEVTAFYGVTGDMAVIEMAAAAGLPLVANNPQPLRATTYGVGQLVRDAAASGCRRILLGLGGSATNDCGCGMLAALGAEFYDAAGAPFLPTGGNLEQIAAFDARPAQKLLADVELTVLSDVTNPLCGPTGAAYVFAAQKGAGAAEIAALDEKMGCFAALIARTLGLDILSLPGGGAAGGMGAGLAALLGVKLRPGIDTLLDLTDFATQLAGCDYLFTGEGRLDRQSLDGKVFDGLCRRARAYGVPVVVIAGSLANDLPDLRPYGVAYAFAAAAGRGSMAEIRRHCRQDLSDAMRRALDCLAEAERDACGALIE